MLLALNLLWRAFRNLIELAILLLLFSRSARGFETTVIAALGLIYAAIRSYAIVSSMSLVQMGSALDRSISDIRVALGLAPLDLEGAEKAITRLYWKVATEGLFVFVFSLLCAFNLLTAY